MQKRIIDLDVTCRQLGCVGKRARFLMKFRDKPGLVWFTQLCCTVHAAQIIEEYGQTETYLRVPQGVYDRETMGL
jgi:hypothetical protein